VDSLEKGGLIADSSKMYLIGDMSPLAPAGEKPEPCERIGGETWRNAWGHWPRHSVAC
jgi:hypothetical protein